jgi:hypothetical protein
MGRKLDRLMARISALEEAFTQLLSENLRHGPVKKTKAAKKAKTKKKAKPKRAAAKKKAAPQKPAAKKAANPSAEIGVIPAL